MGSAALYNRHVSQVYISQPPKIAHYSSHYPKSKVPGARIQKSASSFAENQEINDELYEEIEIELPSHCPGCGVRLQQDDPDAPGFFQVPKKIIDKLSNNIQPEDDGEDNVDGNETTYTHAWSSFDSMVESWAIDSANAPPRPIVQSYSEQESTADDLLSSILCARCYSLQHYGKVKNQDAEASMPGFDFEKAVGRQIALQKFRRSIVLVVVDLADFDGSLPRQAVRSLLPPAMRSSDVSDRYPSGFRLVVAANKSDLLPTKATRSRLESWVRQRMSQGGLPRPSAVHIVSSEKGTGIKPLLADLQAAVGARGDVWVVGAQNAGKSSLINAMRRSVGLSVDARKVTTAPLPGTTLGIVRVPSLLPTGCKMLDTPGVPHAHQLAKYMTADEMKMLLPRRGLKPRTYRLGAGQCVSLGGVARIEVLSLPGATLYLTAWMSDQVVCHFGKSEGAEERYAKHAGVKLVPPVCDAPSKDLQKRSGKAVKASDDDDVDKGYHGDEHGGASPEMDDEIKDERDLDSNEKKGRMSTFPTLSSTDVTLYGDSWQESGMDIAIAGLGWVGVGVNGEASFRVWAPPGVAITTRDALLPDYAKELEKPGFNAQELAMVVGTGKNAAAGGGGTKGGGGGKRGKKRG